jgi:hypothetical protein
MHCMRIALQAIAGVGGDASAAAKRAHATAAHSQVQLSGPATWALIMAASSALVAGPASADIRDALAAYEVSSTS